MADRCGWAIVGFALMLTNPKGASAETRPSIAVVAYNQAGVNADTLARAKSEIARVFGEVGVDVNWMDSADLKPAGRFAIRLLIRARAVDARGSVMGTTIGGAHETGGMAFVFYDRVLKSAHEREQDVSRLLAYAMTHEMGHLLLPVPAHSESGIMRAHWDGDDLRQIAAGVLQFTPGQVGAIRQKASTCCGPLSAPSLIERQAEYFRGRHGPTCETESRRCVSAGWSAARNNATTEKRTTCVG